MLLFDYNKARIGSALRKQGILAEFLSAQRAEVISVSITEYNHEKHMRIVKEEGIEEGIAQGIEQGIAQGKAESLLIMLEGRFGEIPQALQRAISDVSDLDRLDALFRFALKADNLQMFEVMLGK